MSPAVDRLRIDKWLWQARFHKTRGIAARLAASGAVRVNAERVAKASATVRPGDVLTFPQGRTIRVVRVVALGARRGPAAEARELYEDLDPPAPRTVPPPDAPAAPARPAGAGRPTKRERRALDALRRDRG